MPPLPLPPPTVGILSNSRLPCSEWWLGTEVARIIDEAEEIGDVDWTADDDEFEVGVAINEFRLK